jgi:Fe-S oxidoreductase
MRQLPVLEGQRQALETCVFCPKLCRSACPVSNVEATETLTPWGKMSSVYFLAHGDVPASESFARTSLACTGCYACREMCDHKNDVAGTLLAARAAEAALGILPDAAVRVGREFSVHDERTRAAVAELARHPGVRADAPDALLIGCGYVRKLEAESRDAIGAATGLLAGPAALVAGCCGLPLLHAGDKAGFARHARLTAQRLASFRRVLVVDAGCAVTLRQRYGEVATLEPTVELLVELAAREVSRLSPVGSERTVRYHDPCQLGRGLGLYEAPRRVLARALGRAPAEFPAEGRTASCSGAGGLLPVTMPDTARAIAKARMDEHEGAGGGEVVTACASSLIAFRKAADRGAPTAVSDLVSWIARSVPPFRS